jgi:hypothetical protein
MGLDMYLHRKTYVQNWPFNKPEQHVDITITKGGEPYPGIEIDKIKYIVEEVGYWRKANQIHQWFVDNCQNGVDDCGEYYVTVNQLEQLVDICKKVLADPSKADKLLPTQGGFFFGSTDYNEWYIQDLQNTIDQLTPLIEAPTDENGLPFFDYYYHSSW